MTEFDAQRFIADAASRVVADLPPLPDGYKWQFDMSLGAPSDDNTVPLHTVARPVPVMEFMD